MEKVEGGKMKKRLTASPVEEGFSPADFLWLSLISPLWKAYRALCLFGIVLSKVLNGS
jgi:hypothetical protein